MSDQSKIERARERLNAFLSGERGPYEGLTGDIAVILTAEPSRVEDTEVEKAIYALQLYVPGELADYTISGVEIADLIRRLAAAKASAERERDAEKAGAETLDIAAMDANDKLGKLAALVIDMQVASPYGQKVKADARHCMNSGPDPLRETYPHEQEGSISAPLIARAETAEAKLREARGLALADAVKIIETKWTGPNVYEVTTAIRALSNPE